MGLFKGYFKDLHRFCNSSPCKTLELIRLFACVAVSDLRDANFPTGFPPFIYNSIVACHGGKFHAKLFSANAL